MNTYILSKLLAGMVTLVVLFTLITTIITPAFATGTFVWNKYGYGVPMHYAPTAAYNAVKLWIPNNTRFDMHCWTDFQWYTGNYTTNRWFWGQEYSGGYWGYVNASYVFYQTSVPHC